MQMIKHNYRKMTSLFIVLAMILSFIGFKTPVSNAAEGWLDAEIEETDLISDNTVTFSDSDCIVSGHYYKVYRFTVPESPQSIKLRVSASVDRKGEDASFTKCRWAIYEESNPSKAIWDEYGTTFKNLWYGSYDESEGKWKGYHDFSKEIKKGSYYLVIYTGQYTIKDLKDFTFFWEYNPVVKSPSLSATPSKKSIKVRWSKKGTNGYELQYSKKPSFKSCKTIDIKSTNTKKKTIKRLKRKTTYYIRIRAKQNIDFGDGMIKEFYSDWASTKVTTK